MVEPDGDGVASSRHRFFPFASSPRSMSRRTVSLMLGLIPVIFASRCCSARIFACKFFPIRAPSTISWRSSMVLRIVAKVIDGCKRRR